MKIALAILFDIVVAILPIVYLWDCQMSRATKVGVGGILGLGLL